MDVDNDSKPKSLSITQQKKRKAAKADKIEKKRHRKPRNVIAFKRHPKKPARTSKRI